jgi:hypothetical protein
MCVAVRKGPLVIDEDRRYELADTPVTLNGKPAAIFGVKNRFATVAQLPRGEAYEWSWGTVDHVVREHEGRFRS